LPEKSQTETTGQAFRNVTLPPSFPGIENAGQADALLVSVRFTFLGGSMAVGGRRGRRAVLLHDTACIMVAARQSPGQSLPHTGNQNRELVQNV
jgi:hypothetical protein